MKILIVNKFYSPWIGGIETIVQQVAEGVRVQRPTWDVSVLVCSPKPRTSLENHNGVRIVRAGSFGVFLKMPVSLQFFIEFRRLSKDADCIDIHHPFPLAFVAWWLLRPRAKLVVHYHADIVRQRITGALFRPLLRAVLDKAEQIIVTNPSMISSSPVLARFKSKCVVIAPGVTLPALTKESDAAADLLQQQYGRFALFVGRLSYYKGVDVLLRAIATLPIIPLVIIGEGEEGPALRVLAAQLNCGDRVFFLPSQTPEILQAFYRAAAVFVLPSIARTEAFGIVLAEAMAAGTPVISTELGTGTSYINNHETTGYVVPPRDISALAAAVSDLCTDTEKRARFGAAARERVLAHFALDQMVAAHVQVFENLNNTFL